MLVGFAAGLLIAHGLPCIRYLGELATRLPLRRGLRSLVSVADVEDAPVPLISAQIHKCNERLPGCHRCFGRTPDRTPSLSAFRSVHKKRGCWPFQVNITVIGTLVMIFPRFWVSSQIKLSMPHVAVSTECPGVSDTSMQPAPLGEHLDRLHLVGIDTNSQLFKLCKKGYRLNTP